MLLKHPSLYIYNHPKLQFFHWSLPKKDTLYTRGLDSLDITPKYYLLDLFHTTKKYLEYAKAVYGIENPRVGLVNIGEEEEKGNVITKAAFPMLKAQKGINFIGNVEGRDLFNDKVDVAVCDGFTGNVIVKTCEGFFYNLLKRGVEDDFLSKFNFQNYGGTPILGIRKSVIVGHGISNSKTFTNMIKLAKNVVESELISKIEKSISETTEN